jgi:RimJ/RimL family protein N-acetyltransferase
MSELLTPRLTLRAWREADLAPFAQLNADPQVMRYMPRHLSRAESDAFAAACQAQIAARGWDRWAVARRDSGDFVGAVGLSRATFAAAFTPCIEVAWRLRREQWGQGFATEAAAAALEFGFTRLELPEVLAFTVPANRASRAVMERLGMRHHPAEDFEHPRVPPGHALRAHVLYRLTRADWDARRAHAATPGA